MTVALMLALATVPAFAGGEPPATSSATAVPVVSQKAVLKSENDRREYRYLTLANGLRVLLISDPEADKAAAALDVNVGSGSDPRNRQGLAHFLEHMLFLGTQKYPQSGEYQEFISSHGGSHNAFTALENTNFFFDVDPQFLEPAMDRFAQFFIAPTLDPAFADREKHAVDSEFRAKIKDDARREWDVMRELFNERNPQATFGVGNLDTLSDQQDSKIADDLQAFYQSHYSANLMTLAVIGREKLPALQAMVLSRFGAIPNHNLKRESSSVPLFRDGLLPSAVSVQSLNNAHNLSLVFPLPSLQPHYRVKPEAYISYLLGHEGEGSLLAELKKRGWADRLAAGAGLSDQNHATLDVTIALTEAGIAHRDEIVSLFFATVDELKRNGITDWQYAEQQHLLEQAFRFREQDEAIGYVSELAGAMQVYAPEDTVRGGYLMQRYDAALINQMVSRLTPDNLLLVYSAPEVEGKQQSRYYGTPYRLETLSDIQLAQWRKPGQTEALHMPGRNPFIAEKLPLKKLPILQHNHSPVPAQLSSDAGSRLWFLQDQQFRVPKADILVYARSPLAARTPADVVRAELFVRLLRDRLNSTLYTAGLAGQAFAIERRSRGIAFQLQGYSDKQGLLLKTVLENVRNPSFEDERFVLLREEWRRQLQNLGRLPPYQQLMQDVRILLAQGSWDRQRYLAELDKLTLRDVQDYAHEFLASVSADILVHGNLYEADAVKLADVVRNALQLANSKPQPTPVRIAAVPAGASTSLYVDNIEHADTAVVQYFQGVDDSVTEQVKAAMLAQMLKSPFFQSLRTEQQLGYVVMAAAHPIVRVPGVAFMVQSPEHSAADVSQQIDTFLHNELQTLQQQDDAWFEQQRQAVLTQLREKPHTLAEQTDEFWGDLLAGYTGFDQREQQIAALEKLSRKDMLAYYQSMLLDHPRQLMIVSPGKAGLDSLLARKNRTFSRIEDADRFKSERLIYTID